MPPIDHKTDPPKKKQNRPSASRKYQDGRRRCRDAPEATSLPQNSLNFYIGTPWLGFGNRVIHSWDNFVNNSGWNLVSKKAVRITIRIFIIDFIGPLIHVSAAVGGQARCPSRCLLPGQMLVQLELPSWMKFCLNHLHPSCSPVDWILGKQAYDTTKNHSQRDLQK